MIIKLLTEHHLEFLSLKGGCRGPSESIHVKMPHCWKSHTLAHIIRPANTIKDIKDIELSYCNKVQITNQHMAH